jgi:hypothetical protein
MGQQDAIIHRVLVYLLGHCDVELLIGGVGSGLLNLVVSEEIEVS